jgi:hypothetical protein
MSEPINIDHLDDRTVLLILSYLTQDMREQIPTEEAAKIAGQEDAQQLVAELLVETGEISDESQIMGEMPSDKAAADAARQLLVILAEDPQLRPAVEELVASPPQDEQMSLELAIAGAILLGAVVSWLQTNVKIEYSEEGGETKFNFKLEKNAADKSTIQAVAKSVAGLFTGAA